MIILGISAYYHDSSAALIISGKISAACQEERLTRIKHDASFPKQSIKFCLEHSGLKPEQIDKIVFYEKPFLKFERLVETYLAFAPKGFLSFSKAMPLWLNEKLFQKKLLSEELMQLGFSKKQTEQILFSEHHLSHAASAFFASPYSEAAVLTMDGVGEWETTTIYHGKHSSLKKIAELHFPHSLGMLYSAFTYYCGFKVNSGEYKLMGLAPYGTPLYTEKIKNHLLDLKEDGSFKLNMEYFDYCTGLTMTNKKFDALFDFNYRKPESEIKQIHMDLAASVQVVTEEIILKICSFIKTKINSDNLCLAGGVALNCVANAKIAKQGLFKNIWIQPAAGDAGGSLGAALAAHYLHIKADRQENKTEFDSMQGAYLGPTYKTEEIKKFLAEKKAIFTEMTDDKLLHFTVEQLTNEKVVGWFQDRMEFGPRALGNRSILADPRSSKMQKQLNLKIKFRESFRPFAPAVIYEHIHEWFEFENPSPYMLQVAQLQRSKRTHDSQPDFSGLDRLNKIRSVVPAITHVDNSARIQTVHRQTNPKFYNLLNRFYDKTKVPILINTSFNIRGEPIVCSPQDAYKCFMGTHMDVLVIENFVLLKDQQPPENMSDYKHLFDLD